MIVGNVGFELMAPYLQAREISSLLIMTTRDPINANLADEALFYRENNADFQPLYNIAVKNKVDTVISISGPDYANIRDSLLKDELQKMGIKTIANPLGPVRIAADKIKTKSFLRKHGFPFVKGRGIYSINDACSAATELGYPVAIKKTGDSGGKGFFTAYDEKGLKDHLSMVETFPVLIEEFISGHEFSVEVLNYDRKAIALNPVYKGYTMPCGIHPMERVKVSPPIISGDKISLLRSTAKNIISTLGLEPTGDIDFVWSAKGLKIFEINPRFGGVTAISMASTGVNCYQSLINMALGQWNPERIRIKKIPTFDIPVLNDLSDNCIEWLLRKPQVYRVKKQNLKVTSGRVTIQAKDRSCLQTIISDINSKHHIFHNEYLEHFFDFAANKELAV